MKKSASADPTRPPVRRVLGWGIFAAVAGSVAGVLMVVLLSSFVPDSRPLALIPGDDRRGQRRDCGVGEAEEMVSAPVTAAQLGKRLTVLSGVGPFVLALIQLPLILLDAPVPTRLVVILATAAILGVAAGLLIRARNLALAREAEGLDGDAS